MHEASFLCHCAPFTATKDRSELLSAARASPARSRAFSLRVVLCSWAPGQLDTGSPAQGIFWVSAPPLAFTVPTNVPLVVSVGGRSFGDSEWSRHRTSHFSLPRSAVLQLSLFQRAPHRLVGGPHSRFRRSETELSAWRTFCRLQALPWGVQGAFGVGATDTSSARARRGPRSRFVRLSQRQFSWSRSESTARARPARRRRGQRRPRRGPGGGGTTGQTRGTCSGSLLTLRPR